MTKLIPLCLFVFTHTNSTINLYGNHFTLTYLFFIIMSHDYLQLHLIMHRFVQFDCTDMHSYVNIGLHVINFYHNRCVKTSSIMSALYVCSKATCACRCGASHIKFNHASTPLAGIKCFACM